MINNNFDQSIELFDTTLRDGTQGEGINLSVDDKLQIASRLDEFGINIIEGGWPGSNPRDMEFFKRSKSELKLNQASLCAFGSTARSLYAIDSDKNLNELLKSETEFVSIFGKCWSLHSQQGLGLSPNENAELIYRSIEFLVKMGRKVIFDAEHFFDGFNQSTEFTVKMINSAVEGGAKVIVLCDTNGGTLPDDIEKATQFITNKFNVRIGIHAHNDGGLAVANTLTSVKAGVTHIQGTINGVGERCGNVSLSSVIPNLILKMKRKTKQPLILKNLTSINNYIYEIMNIHPDDKAPFVGKSAFAHKGGIHVSAVIKNPEMYEHIIPSLIGNNQRVLVSDLSGKSNINYKAKELNISLEKNTTLTRKLVQKIKLLEFEGFQFESAEASFEIMLKEALGEFTPYFEVLDSRITINYNPKGLPRVDAMLKIYVNGEIDHTIADGNGPVNALNSALKKSLQRFFPELENVKLTDYKVRVLNGMQGTESKVRVLIESSDGENSWTTVGVSVNIIEASWQALRDSFNYKLLRSKIERKKYVKSL
ncbi:MAG: citramalate synthase [Candidatus Marinimicrobia bacterium]|nr:citramalate synthase [Candidatus Neomarinimicrobiota bacterium]